MWSLRFRYWRGGDQMMLPLLNSATMVKPMTKAKAMTKENTLVTEHHDGVIIIYAKAPTPGEVKTRMMPALDALSAALLHSALVERALTTACATEYDVLLCAAPDDSHPFFAECAEDFDIDLDVQQPDANLGTRMLASLNDALRHDSRVLLIGADCPAFTAAHLREAMVKLNHHDIVLTPADDGGYVLIGARRTAPTMFDSIDWGTDSVLAAQRVALQRSQLSYTEMPALWDVDRPEDLPRLATLKPPLPFFLP